MEKELNREQIIKALECCDYGDCYPCPYRSIGVGCVQEAQSKALALINELTEENERLRERNITLEQKLMLLEIDDVYVFKAKVKGE